MASPRPAANHPGDPTRGSGQRLPWQRDLFHLLVGSACGLAVGLALWRLSPRQTDPLDLVREVHAFIDDSYVRQVEPGQLVDAALHGMVEGLDGYSRYYSRDELRAMDRETSGHYKGIGVVFARPVRDARVLFSLPGSPAARAGIGVGDRVLSVAGKSLEGRDDDELQNLLSSHPDDRVRLRVRSREGAEREVEVERVDLIDPTVRHASILEPDLGLGYVAITAFSQETPREFDEAVGRLRGEGMEALIVDVRSNLGGVLRSAVALANRFLREGLIVSQEGRGDPVLYSAEPGAATLAGMPLVILIDAESASASEVFAAALQEHRTAVLVGGKSYGKGMVQQVRNFEGRGAVKLTTAYYYTPSHQNLERTVAHAWESGLVPDLEVALSELETARIHQQLASYGPPAESLDAIRQWEREEHRQLLLPRPPDAQLDAAIALFRGERPGSWLTESPP